MGFSPEFWATEKWATLGGITAKTYVVPISTDWFFPPEDCEAEQRLIPNPEFKVIESNSGRLWT